MVRAYADELFWVLGLFIAVIVTARRWSIGFGRSSARGCAGLVTIFAIYVTATGAGIGFHAAGLPAWSSGCLVAAQIFQAFTLVSLSATLVIAIALPAVGVDLPMIASDLLVGLGYVVVALAVLARHGVNPTGALVSGAVVSAVLAISLQSTLGNIVGGVALQLDGSIREGDWIQLENGKQGQVRSVRWRHTVIEARDWSTIIVPNAQLLGNNITILGKREGRSVPQRLTVGFNIDFRYPPSRVIRTVTDALHSAAIENVADEPPPHVVCNDFTKGRQGQPRELRGALLDHRPDDRRDHQLAGPRADLHGAAARADHAANLAAVGPQGFGARAVERGAGASRGADRRARAPARPPDRAHRPAPAGRSKPCSCFAA